MPLMRTLYIILVIGTVFFYILYIGDASFLLLAFLVLLPIVLFTLLLKSVSRVTLDFLMTQAAYSRSDACKVVITIENKSTLPIGNAEIVLCLRNVITNKSQHLRICVPVNRRNKQTLSPKFTVHGCGIYEISLKRVIFYDLLHLFTRKKKISKTYQFYVLPSVYPVLCEIAPKDLSDAESNKFSHTKKGDDPSEIFNLREFRDGDKQNLIHWKLTAKTGTTFIKEYSLPVFSQIAILCEPVPISCDGFDEIFEAVMDTASSFFCFAGDNGGCTMLYPLDDSEQSIFFSDSSEIADGMCRLMSNSIIANEVYTDIFNTQILSDEQKTICNTLIYITYKYTDQIAQNIISSRLATKYIVIHISSDNADGIYEDGIITYLHCSPSSVSNGFSDFVL